MDSGQKKTYSADKVALLVIFVTGLLIGHLIIVYRTRINLSASIALPFTGLSVSVPVGGGWECPGFWQYNPEGNDFVLTARLTAGGQIAAVAHWRYVLADERLGADEQLAKRVGTAGGEINTGGQIDDYVSISWAQVAGPGGIGDEFFGIGQLGYGRTIEVYVIAPMEPELAEKIFRSVTDSVRFEANDLLEKGDRFLGHVKESGIENLIAAGADNGSQGIYYIDNTIGNVAGFAIYVFDVLGERDRGATIRGRGLHYLSFARSQVNESDMFECDSRFDSFIWKSRYSNSGKRVNSGVEIEMSTDGTMQVVHIGTGRERTYWTGQWAIAEILLDPVAKAFLDSGNEKLMVDVIFSDGMIVPTIFSEISPVGVKEVGEGVSRGVQLEFLHGKKRYLRIYFDEDKRIVKKVMQNQTWHRSNKEYVASKFQGWQEHIEQLLSEEKN